jgi:hypothetical protein
MNMHRVRQDKPPARRVMRIENANPWCFVLVQRLQRLAAGENAREQPI